MERFPTFLFYPLKNCTVRSYLCVKLLILQKGVSHISLAGCLFQSHIPSGCRVSQAIRENLAEQRMIVSIGCHLPTKCVQMGVRISSAIALDKLGCLELGRQNNLREIGQAV